MPKKPKTRTRHRKTATRTRKKGVVADVKRLLPRVNRGMNTLINPAGPKMHQNMPDKYVTWLSYYDCGAFGAGTLSTAAGSAGRWVGLIDMNKILAPRSLPHYSYQVTTPAVTVLPNGISSPTGSAATGAFNWLSSINTAGTPTGLYQYYRVHEFKCKFTVNPLQLSDACYIMGAPISGLTTFVGGTPALSLYSSPTTLTDGSHAKYADCFAYHGKNSLSFHFKLHNLGGVTVEQYSDDITTAGSAGTFQQSGNSANNPAEPYALQLYIQMMDLLTNGTALPWEIEMQYLVEFFSPNNVLQTD